MPGQVDGSGKVAAHLLVGHAHAGPHIVPHGFLPGDGEWHIDAVERHPVDESLPVVPVPKGHGVAIGAVVQKEALWHARCDGLVSVNRRQCVGQVNGNVGIPRYGGVAILLEVAIQAHRHGVGIVAAYEYLVALVPDCKDIAPLFGRFDFLENDFLSQSGRESAGEILGFGHIAGLRKAAYGEKQGDKRDDETLHRL